MKDRKGKDLDGRRGSDELESVEEGETVIKIYCMRKRICVKY